MAATATAETQTGYGGGILPPEGRPIAADDPNFPRNQAEYELQELQRLSNIVSAEAFHRVTVGAKAGELMGRSWRRTSYGPALGRSVVARAERFTLRLEQPLLHPESHLAN
jgi:hypothetical protein